MSEYVGFEPKPKKDKLTEQVDQLETDINLENLRKALEKLGDNNAII